MSIDMRRIPSWVREPLRAGSKLRPRTYLVTGATGFIGRRLCARLIERGERVIVLARDPGKAWDLFGPQVRIVGSLGALGATEAVDVVVNLAGEPIMARPWTNRRRAVLMSSRVELTGELCRWMAQLDRKPAVLVNASAIGYYGLRGDEEITEATRGQPIFQSHLCQTWELAAQGAKQLGVRVCCLRFGLVLGRTGGALPGLANAAKARLRVVLGSGEQWVSWIHVEDLLRLVDFCVENEELQGSLNATAPAPVRQRELATILARTFGRAIPIQVPDRMLRWILGERAQLLVDGQRVVPTRAMAAGFSFRYDTLEAALRELFGSSRFDPAPLQIMYDPDCPVCDSEMSRYCREARQVGHEWSFHDVADRPDLMQRYGLSTDLARRRVYVLTDEGTMVSGIPAICLIWAGLPRWRWLARIVRFPGVQPLAEFLYDKIIAPTVWRANILRREREATNAKAAR